MNTNVNTNINDTTRHVRPPPTPMRGDEKKTVLHFHKRAFLLLLFYIPLVLIPWVVTMIMVHRPLTRPSWIRLQGFWMKDYKVMKGWATAIPIMNACAAVVAITVTSAVIAQAAVVFSQRRHPGQQLNVKQLFSLADRVWCDLGALPRSVTHGNARWKGFVLGATALVLLGAVQYPLIQILVSWEDSTISNCRSAGFIQDRNYDNRWCDVGYAYGDVPRNDFTTLGQDLEPAQLAVVSLFNVLPRIKNDLSQIVPGRDLDHLWQDAFFEYGRRLPASMENLDQEHFVTVLPINSTTGVLRQHLMRMHSNVTCTNHTASEFPSTCTGTNPFQASWDYHGLSPSYNGTLELCVPGDQGKHPWTLSRNRQDINEELFIKYRATSENRLSETIVEEEVFHCKAQTTRGYFELGNIYNGGQHGPLLDKWPTDGSPEQAIQYNDWFESEWGPGVGTTPAYFPSEEDHGLGYASATPDPRGESDYFAPETYTNVTGPLMTSVLALFGRQSWSGSVLNLTSNKSKDELQNSHTEQTVLLEPLCKLAPYRRGLSVDSSSSYRTTTACRTSLWGMRSTLDDFLEGWTQKGTLETKLRTSMFIANRALLTANAYDDAAWQPWAGRGIYTAPGWTVSRPYISLPAQIILSLIVATHVLGLLVLALLIHRYPTWTRTLDSLAVARVAASLDPTLLPPFRATTHADAAPLATVDGLVGVQEDLTPILHPRRRERSSGSAVHEGSADREIEMEALSVASTVGKEPSSSASPAYDTSLSLGLGAPGAVPRHKKVDVPPPIPRRMDV